MMSRSGQIVVLCILGHTFKQPWPRSSSSLILFSYILTATVVKARYEIFEVLNNSVTNWIFNEFGDPEAQGARLQQENKSKKQNETCERSTLKEERTSLQESCKKILSIICTRYYCSSCLPCRSTLLLSHQVAYEVWYARLHTSVES